MTSLSGDKIQELLWAEGLDFTYTQTVDNFSAMEIPCGIDVIRLERLWTEDGEEWFLDDGDVFITHYRDHAVSSQTYSNATTEEDLVEELLALHEEIS